MKLVVGVTHPAGALLRDRHAQQAHRAVRRAALGLSALSLLACILAPASLAAEKERRGVRIEVVSTQGTPIHILEIMDVTDLHPERPETGSMRSVQLWSVGSDLRFVFLTAVSMRDKTSRFDLIGPGSGEVVTFEKGPKVEGLADEDREKGFGILRAKSERLLVNREDARAATVRARVDRVLAEAFDAERLGLIREALASVRRCPMMLGRGALQPLLEPAMLAPLKKSDRCTAAFRNVEAVERNAAREREFLSFDPSVREFLSLATDDVKGVRN